MSKYITRWSLFGITLCVLMVSGCANLAPVREFANASSELSGFKELTDRYNTTYERERHYLYGPAEQEAIANDKLRKDAYQDLVKIHDAASLYMKTLGKLAGEETFNVTEDMKSVGGSLKKHPGIGITDSEIDAVSSVATIAAKWVMAGAQEQAVKSMVREGDAPFQTLLKAMKKIVRLYAKTNDNERRSVLSVFRANIPYASNPEQRLILVLSKVHQEEKTKEYSLIQTRYARVEQGIDKISLGHATLLKNLEHLSRDEVKDSLQRLSKDIRVLTKSIKSRD